MRLGRESFRNELLADLTVYPYTKETAMLAGKLDGEQQSRGVVIPFEDLLIGATAPVNGATGAGIAVLITNICWPCSTTRAEPCIFLPSLFSTGKCRRFLHSNHRTNPDLEWRQ